MKKTKLYTFKGFKSIIGDLTVQNLQDIKMEASVDDAIAQTCIHLTQNSEMQNNIREAGNVERGRASNYVCLW